MYLAPILGVEWPQISDMCLNISVTLSARGKFGVDRLSDFRGNVLTSQVLRILIISYMMQLRAVIFGPPAVLGSDVVSFCYFAAHC